MNDIRQLKHVSGWVTYRVTNVQTVHSGASVLKMASYRKSLEQKETWHGTQTLLLPLESIQEKVNISSSMINKLFDVVKALDK